MRTFLRRLRARVKYWNHARDVAREIEVHREMAAARLARDGACREEARAGASRLLGNTTLSREEARDVWIARWLQDISQDVRYGVRSLKGRPSFTVTALGMLVLGLGLSASVFSVFNAIFLRSWPLPDPDRVVVVRTTWGQDRERLASGGAALSFGTAGLPYQSWLEIRRDARTAAYTFASYDTFGVPFKTPAGLPYLNGAFVDDDFFDVLRVPMQIGAGFTGAHGTGATVAVITDSTWHRYFKGDPAIIGTTITLSGVAATVVGVTRSGFEGLPPTEMNVIVPASAASHWPRKYLATALNATDPRDCCVSVSGRLRPGMSIGEAKTELTFLMGRYTTDRGTTPTLVFVSGTSALSQRDLAPKTAAAVSLIAAGCGLVWLLVCANVGNLELARGLAREREVQTRLSLGAGRGRIVRQFLTEGVMLAALAGTLAYFAAGSSSHALATFLNDSSAFGFAPDRRVAIVIACLAIVAALLFSLAPALQVTRGGPRAAALSPARRPRRLRGLLLGTQVAIGAVLTLTGALLTHSVSNALSGRADFAVSALSVVTISPPVENPNYADHLQLRAAWARTTEAMSLAGIPFASAMQPPIGTRKSESKASAEGARSIQADVFPMAANGMSLLDIPIVAGRNYSDIAAMNEVVVNETFAQRMWPGDSALGKWIEVEYPEKGRRTIVGVARDSHLTSFGELKPMIHEPLPHSVPFKLQALIRRDATNESLVRKVLAQQDPALGVAVVPLSDSIRQALRDAISGASIAGVLGGLALALAIAGIFGVFAFIVEERRKEIGIRLALGADRVQISASMVRVLAWPLALGLMFGMMLAVIAGMALRRYLLGISPLDPLAYAGTVALLMIAAVTAAFIPLRRAMRVDPAITLRQD
jgi:predicted permease